MCTSVGMVDYLPAKKHCMQMKGDIGMVQQEAAYPIPISLYNRTVRQQTTTKNNE